MNNKKGSALMQVLVLGGVIASVVILLLRFSVTRTTNIIKTTRKLAAKTYAEGCMAQFTAAAMLRELHGLPPPWADEATPDNPTSGCPKNTRHFYTCSYNLGTAGTAVSKTMCFQPIPGGYYTDGTVTTTIPSTLDRIYIDVTNSDQLK